MMERSDSMRMTSNSVVMYDKYDEIMIIEL